MINIYLECNYYQEYDNQSANAASETLIGFLSIEIKDYRGCKHIKDTDCLSNFF